MKDDSDRKPIKIGTLVGNNSDESIDMSINEIIDDSNDVIKQKLKVVDLE